MSEATENEDFELVGQLATDLQRLCEGEQIPPEISPSPRRSVSHSNTSTNERIMSVASPATPNYHASVASPSLPAAASTNVDITVPNGTFPGQKLAVKLVDGRDVEVVVPPGMQAGQVFRVAVPAATGVASVCAWGGDGDGDGDGGGDDDGSDYDGSGVGNGCDDDGSGGDDGTGVSHGCDDVCVHVCMYACMYLCMYACRLPAFRLRLHMWMCHNIRRVC